MSFTKRREHRCVRASRADATPVFWSAVLVVFVVTLAFPGARSGAVS